MAGLPSHLLPRDLGGPIDGFDPNISNGTCYRKTGTGVKELPDHYIPCGNSAIGHVGCCQAGDKCLEFGACYNTTFGTTYISGCTDEEYQDASCPQKAFEAAVWLGLIYCDSEHEWKPCIQNNDYPEYITKKPADCDKAKVCTNADVAAVFPTFTANRIPDIGWLNYDQDERSLSWLVSDPSAVYHEASTTKIQTIISSPDSTYSKTTLTTGTAFSTSTPSAVPPGPTATSSTDDSSNLSTGAIVGIGVGVGALAILILVGLAIFFIVRRRRAEHEPNPSGTDESSNTADDAPGKESKSPISPGGNSQGLHASPMISELDSQADRPWSLRSELHGNTVSPSAFSPATTSHASFQPSPMMSEASEGQGYAMGHAYKPYGGDHLRHINELPA
ncbi:hypothetical protein SMACR_08589 [Sordaria macrospora]|uniref:WGS project CABT00000000 data, contig 2.2 n=2 Tax=Sordaria macrospora TaxID=5147 RepID=F7VMM7_SORMK|nr:uncharacterized protein SMAC_08589 [Sordaria macrospora k-hell]KAA8633092.1 hypothetical protein SMACR_08589 [Sordaria macrospora]WPJ62469.1 hypothetical protein SMAC4_08589 [Sordaria macrospora]CCC07208.1 unnamed protein product [Sordaria macrospora k-hell]